MVTRSIHARSELQLAHPSQNSSPEKAAGVDGGPPRFNKNAAHTADFE